MACEHAPRRHARPGSQLEHAPRVDPVRRARQLVLDAVVVRDLDADHLQVAVRIPMKLSHALTVTVPAVGHRSKPRVSACRPAYAAAASARSRPAALAA